MAKILIAIPRERFNDEELTSVASILKNLGHIVEIGSNHHLESEGHFGLVVKPDVNLASVTASDYDALVFIGGRGVDEFFKSESTHYLIRAYNQEGKILAAIGIAVEIFSYASIISAKKVTCDSEGITKIQYAGAYYTGKLVEKDHNIITGADSSSRNEFAKTIASTLEYNNHLREMRYARTT